MSRDKPTHRADASALLDDRGYSGTLIRGQNPALLIEKAVRDRITESYYWKEQCFGLNAATLCDRATELRYVGGTYGTMGKPTPFLCLLFKLLQLTPEKEVILEYLNFSEDEDGDEEGSDDEGGVRLGNGDEGLASGPIPLHVRNKRGAFKYLRALAAFYIRLTWEPVEIYNTLEPLLSDYRKLKRRTRDGFTLTYMDQLVDDLLTKDRIFATALWKMPAREHLEDLDMLEPRVSPLGEEVEALDEEMQELEDRERRNDEANRSDRSRSRSRSRGRDDRDRYSDDYSDRYSDRSSRSRTRSRSPRSRSRSLRSRSRSYSSDDGYRRRKGRDSRSRDRSYDRRSPRSRSRDRDSYDRRRSPRLRSSSMDRDDRRRSPRSGTRSMGHD
jgi:pre-mRNA-splicing factor 38A